MSSVNIATIQSTGDQVQDMQNLFDAYARLRKELIHGLSFLDDENVPMLKTIVGDIAGAFTAIEQTEEAITLLATDVSGNTSAISVQAGQIQSLVTSVNGQSSAITQLSNEISLKVDSGDYSASVIVSMINNASAVTINADKINLNGVTTMDGLAQVYGTLRLGTPYSTYSKLLMGSTSFLESGNNIIDVVASAQINLNTDHVYANGTVHIGTLYATNHNIVAKFG